MSLFTVIYRARSYLAPLFFVGAGFCSVALAAPAADEAAPTATSVSATLAWADVTRLSTPVSGVVAFLPVQPGQVVAKGSVLLRLDRAPFADRFAVIGAERSGLVRAAAEARRDAERTQQLFDRTVASESERQDARADLMNAEAHLNPGVAAGIQLGQSLKVQVNQTTATGRVVALTSEAVASGASYRLMVQFQPQPDWIAALPAQIDLP